MKRLIAVTSIAAAAIAISLAPASAKWGKKYRSYNPGYAYGQQYDPYAWNGWHNGRSMPFADPSFGNRGAINFARSTGRCVEDLGYGRFEYCGW